MCQLTSWFKIHPFVLPNYLHSGRASPQTYTLVGFYHVNRFLMVHDRETGQGAGQLVCKLTRDACAWIGMTRVRSRKVCG